MKVLKIFRLFIIIQGSLTLEEKPSNRLERKQDFSDKKRNKDFIIIKKAFSKLSNFALTKFDIFTASKKVTNFATKLIFFQILSTTHAIENNDRLLNIFSNKVTSIDQASIH